MTRTRLKSRGAVLTVLGGAVLAAILPVSAAVAFDSSPDTWQVQVASTAGLEARGAAVSVPVSVQCPYYYSSAGVSVTLTQRQGSSTVTASGSTTVHCTGSPSGDTVYVVVESGQRVFKKGTGCRCRGDLALPVLQPDRHRQQDDHHRRPLTQLVPGRRPCDPSPGEQAGREHGGVDGGPS